MTEEKWQDVVGQIKDSFTVLEEQTDRIAETRAEITSITFTGPMGKLKLERVRKPRVVSQRAVGGSKFGAGKSIERVFSKDEMIDALHAYRWDAKEAEWVDVDASSFVSS